MRWINYNHLYYFWRVGRHGSVVRAAEELLVSQPTVSAQIRELEAAMGRKLFERSGRGLQLTEDGRLAFGYAEGMFSLGQELMNAMEHHDSEPRPRLRIGIVDIIPKTVVRLVLEPLGRLEPAPRMICLEDKAAHLLADLSARRLDVILSDAPISVTSPHRGFSHLLGQCGVSFFASRTTADRLRRGFPRSLNKAPMLLPSEGTALRRSLDVWFDANRIRPAIAGEFDDAALLISFGRAGEGVFPAPSAVADEIRHEHHVSVVGRTRAVRQRFYIITLEEKPTHPAVLAIRDSARREIFS